ncbi:putative meiotic recombination protein dmc1 [Diaporthe ampelina]|uniref:Putative meiotic recombination protein dmc1 n=1 Tax=Diaporthe ampelina TaxID=1214573 RepID=A0A0G2FP81_9PEZI|nr:putative meiotic recombination protein dmc1 [Diaporthe ampelina]
MADTTNSPGPGGFLPQHPLPSPAPSGSSSRPTSGLPHPRSHPLRSGSAKEQTIRAYVDNQLMHIQRRFVKRSVVAKPGDDIVGYKAIGELCKDVEALLDIIWLSGTPALQIPYLLNIANEFTEWVTKFPPQPEHLFTILKKLDYCFASLLGGQDVDTKETLPGFENGSRGVITKTDMVRCKSIVEQTRVVIVDVMSKQPDENGGSDESETEDDTEKEITEAETDTEGNYSAAESSGFVDPNWEDPDDELYMDVARVYEKTLVQLGEVMDEAVLP